jgi:hypothetical protein
VVSGEQRDLPAGVVGRGEHEPGQQVEPRVAGPHLVPQVAGAVAGTRRIARPVAIAPVEWKEASAVAEEPGGHEHLLGIDREVDDRPPQEGVARIAVAPVLLLGILRRLPVAPMNANSSAVSIARSGETSSSRSAALPTLQVE